MHKAFICYILFALIATVLAKDPNYAGFVSVDWVASAPGTYDPSVGGGAYNSRQIGVDVVESLQGGDLGCGDAVSFLVYLSVSDAAPEPLTINVNLDFLADNTGGSPGVAFANIYRVSINDPATDSAVVVSGDETAELISETMTAPIFSKAAVLQGTVQITGLGAGESIVVRLDVQLACIPNSSPTGNLGGSISSVTVENFATSQVVTKAGQNIPLKNVDLIQGIIDCYNVADRPVLDGVTFTSPVEISDGVNGVITADFAYSWEFGAWIIDNTVAGTVELHTFETVCTNDHDGEYLFVQGSCGPNICEETFIGSNQAQLFYESASTYFLPSTSQQLVRVNGVDILTNVYYPNPNYWAPQAITALYLDASTDAIVRADWDDGRSITFLDPVYVTPDITFTERFVEPTSCKCRRDIDMIIAVDAADITQADMANEMQEYLTNFVAGFNLSGNANIGLYEYDDVVTSLLPVIAGTSAAAVESAIGTIGSSCTGTGSCGTGKGDVELAITTATTELAAVNRGEKIIVIITNGWEKSDTYDVLIETAVTAAANEGITVLIIAQSSFLFPEDLLVATNGNPDNLVWYWTTEQFVNADPVEVNSRVCLLAASPCGSNCCGYCDSACGDCIPLDSCDDTGDCNTAYFLDNDGCCALTTEPFCDQTNLGPCEEAVCQPDGTCVVSGCSDLNNDCYNYTCVSGECVGVPLNEDTVCTKWECVGGVHTPTQITCPPDTECQTYGNCVEGVGCVATPTPPPIPGPCQVVGPCVPGQPWVAVDIDCSEFENNDLCNTYACNPALGVNGECEATPKCSRNNNDLCDLTTCDPNTGNCIADTVQCLDDGCNVNGVCNPNTGRCEFSQLVCPPQQGWDGSDCLLQKCVDGACVLDRDICPCNPNLQTCDCPNCDSDVCTNRTCTNSVCVEQDYLCPEDECNISQGCTTAGPNPGCSYSPVVCNGPLSSTCNEWVRDPDTPGCCVEVNTCEVSRNDCWSYECDELNGVCVRANNTCTALDSDCQLGQCSNGQCVTVDRATDLCTDSTDPCKVNECDLDGNCVERDVVCTASDFCREATCVAGMCVEVERVCPVANLCEVAVCDSSAASYAEACPTPTTKVCNGDCARCSLISGECIVDDCNDGFSCTTDACVNGECVHTPIDNRCTSADPCKDLVCLPESPDANPVTGCSAVPFQCVDDGLFCSFLECKPFEGCLAQQINCRENVTTTDNDCDLYYCSEDEQTCIVENKECVVPISTGTIVGAALGTAAVVGIVVGIIVGVALCAGGAGVYTVYRNTDDESAAAVANNPLYVGSDKGGDNPIFSATS